MKKDIRAAKMANRLMAGVITLAAGDFAACAAPRLFNSDVLSGGGQSLYSAQERGWLPYCFKNRV